MCDGQQRSGSKTVEPSQLVSLSTWYSRLAGVRKRIGLWQRLQLLHTRHARPADRWDAPSILSSPLFEVS
jgi:hypothetical protein